MELFDVLRMDLSRGNRSHTKWEGVMSKIQSVSYVSESDVDRRLTSTRNLRRQESAEVEDHKEKVKLFQFDKVL